MTETPTGFASLTPTGTAAVATIAVIGPRAWQVVREMFRPAGTKPLPSVPATDRFWHGSFGEPPGDAVVLAARATELVTWVELHCHGGTEVIRLLGAELQRQGLTAWTDSRFLTAVGTSAVDALAKAALAEASTLRSASILLDQVHGAFRRAVEAVAAAVDAGDTPAASSILTELAGRASLGRHLTRPWRVALAGAPNVGKSSLVNALVGYRRAVVTPTAGTTRDAVAVATAVDGWPVELTDTAGRHAAGDKLEGQGIARGRAVAASADLCLWVVSRSEQPVWPDVMPASCLVVVNKSDLPAAWDSASVSDAVAVSARTGTGLADLCGRVSKMLVPDPPPPGAAVPFTSDLADLMASLVVSANSGGDLLAALASLVRQAQPIRPR